MESASTTQPSTNGGFIKHMSEFDATTKARLLNMAQYTLLAVVPITLVEKGMTSLFPEADKDKGSAELLAEMAFQIIITLVILFFIHRLITYIPTYSGEPMESLQLLSVATVFLVASIQSESLTSGKKAGILYRRASELWEGKEAKKKKEKGKGSVVKVTQPIARNGFPTHQASRADYAMAHNRMGGGRPAPPSSATPGVEPISATSQSIYGGPVNKLIDANVAGGPLGPNVGMLQSEGVQEPMAANAMLGGSFGSAW